MKYELIRSMSHNWPHSFMRSLNYSDGRFVFEDLHDLERHLRQHRVDVRAVVELRTEVWVAENFRVYVRAYALDDRGREYAAFAWT